MDNYITGWRKKPLWLDSSGVPITSSPISRCAINAAAWLGIDPDGLLAALVTDGEVFELRIIRQYGYVPFAVLDVSSTYTGRQTT